MAAPDPYTTLTAITLFTDDLARSKAFYEILLGGETVHEDEDSTVLRAGPTMVNLLGLTAAPALVAPRAPAGAGVRAVYTIRVGSVDARVAELQEAGLEMLNGPADRPWGVRSATLEDPSGHIWELAQDLN